MQKGEYVHTLYHGEEVVAQIIDIELHERTQEPMYLLYACPPSHNGLSVSFWGYDNGILSVETVSKFLFTVTDERGETWYKLRKSIRNWPLVKACFQRKHADYFVHGWATQAPYVLVKQMISIGEWKL